MKPRLLALAAAVLLVPALSGCVDLGPSADPSKFYTLSPIAEARKPQGDAGKLPEAASGEEGKTLSLGIGPIKLPGYLDREGIVRRTSRNRIEISDLDRWAEPLREEFSRVLSQNLAALCRTDRILTYPWQVELEPAVRVGVDVLRFEPAEDRTACLQARWAVFKAGERKPAVVQESVLSRPVGGAGAEEAVAALSEILGELSREIAGGVEAASGPAGK